MPRLLLFITEDWYFWSHRLPVARAAMAAGFEVTLVTRVNRHAERIRAEGIRLVPIALERRGAHPWRELRAIAALIGIYRRERPDIVHHVALKPVLYGSLAARLSRVPAVVNALAGLGFVFSSRTRKARLLRPWVKLGLRLLMNHPASHAIVQNNEDRDRLIRAGAVDRARTVLIPGSGVDLTHFVPAPEPEGPPVVVLVARMLADKGVVEFVDAARRLRQTPAAAGARFVLVGAPDPENPAAIAETRLRAWQSEGVVEWIGHRDDMCVVYAGAHVVCLPSWREGLPKVLIEAAACGRAIVTTDVPGCRDVVRDGENGLLVPPRDAGALARALVTLIGDAALRARMGAAGRARAERDFGVARVTDATLAVYRRLLAA